jgi:hypothetical protein
LFILKRKTAATYRYGQRVKSFVVIPGYSLIASSFRITIAGALPSRQ